ncbi:hypothetical protein SLS60_004691 [Paraconiothyrium brasiliense]|uniref:Protein kinase domain-containing protein n=1 Tax=Paraconiothyrium brasiliense TaxID=300254 RepID=A0ABR3RLJ5_9PLEO
MAPHLIKTVPDGDYFIIEQNDEEPVEAINVLDYGSLGFVEEVRYKGSDLSFIVRKRIHLPRHKRKLRVDIVLKEATILKTMSHPHIVSLLGAYEDARQLNRSYFCLLMAPVGEADLKCFLELAGESTLPSMHGCWVKQWFMCLSSALAYIHEHGVRHQDIKPSNIIHRGSNVYFTDFSSAGTFNPGHTTSADTPSRSSWMYAATEIVNPTVDSSVILRHGRGSDIFALGCVFCEMLTVLTHRKVLDFHNFLRNPSNNDADLTGLADTDTHLSTQMLYSQRLAVLPYWFKKPRFLCQYSCANARARTYFKTNYSVCRQRHN